MKTAQIALRKVIIGTLLAAALAFPKAAWAAAGAKVTCNAGDPCSIGEFLYDDSYAPIDSASCVINSLYPNASTFLNIGVSSPSESEGWYSHSFTAPTTTGYYRTQICCTSGADYLCLDKSFDVATAAATAASTDEIAEAVWGYSTRTMSGFGTLTADIWGYSSRTMSGFGNLISDLWGYSSRTLTGTQATNITSVTNNVTSIEKTVTEIQTQLEQIVNKPVIQNFLEEVPDLGAKISETKTTADQLFMNNQYVVSRTGLLELKWNTLTDGELLENVVGLGNVLGEETDDISKGSIFGQIAWLKSSWTWPLVEEVFDQTKAVKAALTTVETKLMAEGKSSSAKKELKNLNYYLVTLEKLIGDNTDLAGQETLFSKLRETRELAEALDSRETEVNELLANWKSNENKDVESKIDVLSKKVITVNRIPQGGIVLASSNKGESLGKRLKNQLLGLRALIVSNRLLLAKGTASFANTWLEEGSMVFKSLVTNPSKIINQKVALKYYLPSEVKKENIIETDEGLAVSFDSEKNQYYVEGEFNLRPGESKTVAVKVADIWVFSEDEINSLRKQADELSRPLEKTSYFAQGVTLKSDIDVSLDKILVLQEDKITPEEKIRAYREAQIELNAVNVKMEKLKELVTQAGSTSNLLGFVGGSQTMAVWGLIIILLAGFVFLAIYMRTVINGKNHPQSLAVSEVKEKTAKVEMKKNQTPGGIKIKQIVKTAFTYLVFGALTAVVSGVVVWRVTLASAAVEKPILAQQMPEVQGLSVEEPKARLDSRQARQDEEKKEELIKIEVPVGGAVNLRKDPELSSQILMQLRSSQDAQKLEVLDEWVKVSFSGKDDPQEPLVGWVSNTFVSSE